MAVCHFLRTSSTVKRMSEWGFVTSRFLYDYPLRPIIESEVWIAHQRLTDRPHL